MTRGNRLTNEELEEIRERAERATYGARYHDSDAIFASYCRMNLPKLLAEVEFRREQQAMLREYNRRYLANLKQMITENEYLREGLSSIADGASSADSPDQLADTAKYYLEGRTD